MKADFASVSDPSQYEVLTCLKTPWHGDVPPKPSDADRAADGTLKWHWQPGGRPLDQGACDKLVKAEVIRADESPFDLHDAAGGQVVRIASGSIAYSPYLKRWTMLFTQSLGESVLGEVWFATADGPQGPWRKAVKVATHAMPKNDNDFYNPIQHDELTRGDGRYVYFEGTFVNSFSGNPHPTPYYNYNNLMYRLDLADPRLAAEKGTRSN